jgi:hypothetical protein
MIGSPPLPDDEAVEHLSRGLGAVNDIAPLLIKLEEAQALRSALAQEAVDTLGCHPDQEP